MSHLTVGSATLVQNQGTWSELPTWSPHPWRNSFMPLLLPKRTSSRCWSPCVMSRSNISNCCCGPSRRIYGHSGTCSHWRIPQLQCLQASPKLHWWRWVLMMTLWCPNICLWQSSKNYFLIINMAYNIETKFLESVESEADSKHLKQCKMINDHYFVFYACLKKN